VIGTVAGVLIEPVDLVMTAGEIISAPGELGSYVGLIPGIPAKADDLVRGMGKKIDDLIDWLKGGSKKAPDVPGGSGAGKTAGGSKGGPPDPDNGKIDGGGNKDGADAGKKKGDDKPEGKDKDKEQEECPVKEGEKAGETTKPKENCFVAGTWILTGEGYEEIEDLRVGDRVLTSDANEQDSSTLVDELAWRHLKLSLPNENAPGDVFELEILRPQSWVEERRCAEGNRVWIDLEELSVHGWAHVNYVGPCPPI
jgi:hypothetical protein